MEPVTQPIHLLTHPNYDGEKSCVSCKVIHGFFYGAAPGEKGIPVSSRHQRG